MTARTTVQQISDQFAPKKSREMPRLTAFLEFQANSHYSPRFRNSEPISPIAGPLGTSFRTCGEGCVELRCLQSMEVAGRLWTGFIPRQLEVEKPLQLQSITWKLSRPRVFIWEHLNIMSPSIGHFRQWRTIQMMSPNNNSSHPSSVVWTPK